MNQEKANKASFILLGIFILLGVFLSSIRSIVKFITNIQWFNLNEYLDTYLVKVKTEFVIIIPILILVTLGLYYYLIKLKKRYYHTAHIFYNAGADKRIHVGMGLFSVAMGFFVSLLISSQLWLKVQMFIHSENFNIKDPIFDKDISFYVFKLPLYEDILTTLILLTVFLAMITVAFFFVIISVRQASENKVQEIHYITPQQKFTAFFDNEVVHSVIRKIAFLGLVVFLLLSFRYYLKGYELMYSTRGVAYGASYTDIHVTLIVYRILSIVSFILSFVFCFALIKNKRKIAIAVPVVLISIAVIGGFTGLFVQQLVVEPNEISKEKEYLEYNIKHTQQAFALESVKTESFNVDQNLEWEDIEKNDTTINNIRINDARPLQQTYNQIQGIRLYYTFNDIDLDRYIINDKYMQLFISARELNQNKLSSQAKTWINEHLKYTHGYGVVMSPVNSVTAEGQPELMVQNIPPISDYGIEINRPEIYFGELADQYVVINTKEDEFDYPSGSDNKTTRYQGDAGIKLNGINRFLFAIRERSMKLFVSSVVTKDSRIILHRNIVDRVRTIAPFLTLDQNPYLVLNQEDNNLYWIIDAYTTSKYYPYSQMFAFKNESVNYIRNSVKITVDAYNGTTKFYVIDEEDPILSVYDSIFSDLFLDMDEFPTGLFNHIKYPQDFFDVQTEVFRSYHVNNPEVFYNGEDMWDVANEKYMDGEQRIESNYVMFKLPDSEKEEFALIVPYTPKEKANMTSLFVARNDGANYGKLYIYRFPKDKTIQGPMMIESRIDQDSIISPQFTLWGQEGSSVLRGNLIVVPVDNSIMYVEPIYLQADNSNSLPEMKQVIVAYQEKIIMAKTLDSALRQIFEVDTTTIEVDTTNLSPELIDVINQLNAILEDSIDNTENLENIVEDLNRLINNEK